MNFSEQPSVQKIVYFVLNFFINKINLNKWSLVTSPPIHQQNDYLHYEPFVLTNSCPVVCLEKEDSINLFKIFINFGN